MGPKRKLGEPKISELFSQHFILLIIYKTAQKLKYR
jgi:hypothetical protein